jgi:lysyl-tRNA synthetase class 2
MSTTPETTPHAAGGDPAGVHHLEAQRRANRQAIADLGYYPYGERREGLISLAEARRRYDPAADAAHQAAGKTPPPGYSDKRPVVSVAGRIVLRRDNGKLLWLTLRDHTGDLQVAVSKADVDEKSFALAKTLDLGDLIVVSGRLMKTRTDEITVWATKDADKPALEPAAKCLMPPPEKHSGLHDVEQRYRRRYVDLWATPDTMRVFSARSKIISRIRRFLDERSFVEVETPTLQQLAGGAAARPFVTHMNALDIDLFLRIAPELYLKRLLVGGMPRVYEVSRNFRNEGLDYSHNPEFTMVEIYEAFGNYEKMMDLTEELVRELATMISKEIDINPLRKPVFTGGQYKDMSIGEVFDRQSSYIKFELDNLEKFGQHLAPDVVEVLRWIKAKGNADTLLRPMHSASTWETCLPFGDLIINYGPKFERVSYSDLFQKTFGFPMTDTAKAREEAKRRGFKTTNDKGQPLDDILIVGELFDEVAEKNVDPTRPTFIYDYPAPLCPLTRPKLSNTSIAERFELFMGGMEIANAYTELNDPDVQEAKFREQLQGIDDEQSTFRTFDQDFVDALKVGMPPAGGLGIGIDRLVMLLTNQRSIRDVLLFPMMRPQ